MNANTEKEFKKIRKKSGQKAQQVQFEYNTSITNEPEFQPGDDYDEQFPQLGESSSSQVSNQTRRASEVWIVLLFCFAPIYCSCSSIVTQTTSSHTSQETATITGK